jgi:hypothetical protein
MWPPTLSDLIAFGALVVSGLAFWQNVLTRRQLKESQTPIVAIDAQPPGRDEKGWAKATLRIRSRSNLGYTVKEVRCLWPMGIKIGQEYDFYRSNSYIRKLEVPADLTDRCDPRIEVGPQESGDRASGHRSLLVGPMRPSIWERDFLSWFSSSSDSCQSRRVLFMVIMITEHDVRMLRIRMMKLAYSAKS